MLSAFVAVLAVLFILVAWPSVYWAYPIEATVVDKDTSKPVVGAVAVANWDIVNGFPETSPVAELAIEESVTDKHGHFHLAGWGPKFLFFHGQVDTTAPKIVIYKPGYMVSVHYNNYVDKRGHWRVRAASDWNSKKIGLRAIGDSLTKNGHQLRELNNELYYVTQFAEGCYWQKIPEILKAIIKEENRLERLDPVTYSKPNTTVDVLLASNASYTRRISSTCISPKQFIEGLR
ncbi:MAG TPA: hypothetical protein VFK03_00705 [Candidatus Saccharimonadales bacterium]|nr:hypothetical protein [Candidatus Saccharimonadales bacterium]